MCIISEAPNSLCTPMALMYKVVFVHLLLFGNVVITQQVTSTPHLCIRHCCRKVQGSNPQKQNYIKVFNFFRYYTECIQCLIDVSQNTTKIQYVNLSHNCFGEMSGVILGPAISDNTCIKELDLSWNCLRRKGAVAIAQGLKVCFLKMFDYSCILFRK